MAKSPLVSVVVPMFNVGPYLEDCVRSVLAQTMGDLELILIDDCSTDDSYRLARELAQSDARVTALHNEVNIGQGLTRNRGIDVACGEYVTFVDPDDFIAPAMYERLLDLARGYRADIARCSFRRVSSRMHEVAPVPHAEAKLLEGDLLQAYVRGYFGMLPGESLSDAPSASPCTALYRTALLHSGDVRFPSERIVRSEDLFFNLEASTLAHRVVLVDEAHYFYYVRPGSTSRTFSSPASKCELLERMAPEGDECRMRLARTRLTSVKEGCMQLAASGVSLAAAARTIRQVERDISLRATLRGYPLGKLPTRERMFARLALLGWGWPEVLLAQLDRIRSIK